MRASVSDIGEGSLMMIVRSLDAIDVRLSSTVSYEVVQY